MGKQTKYLLNKQFYLHLVIWCSHFVVFSVNGFVEASSSFHTCKKKPISIKKRNNFIHTDFVMKRYAEKTFFVEGEKLKTFSFW